MIEVVARYINRSKSIAPIYIKVQSHQIFFLSGQLLVQICRGIIRPPHDV